MLRFNWFHFIDNCHIAKFKHTVYQIDFLFFIYALYRMNGKEILMLRV